MNKSGFNIITTKKGSPHLIPEYHMTGRSIGSQFHNNKKNDHAMYAASLAYLTPEEAGVWNLSLRTCEKSFSSIYILEGNYSFNNSTGFNDKSVNLKLINNNSGKDLIVENGVLNYTHDDFLNMMKKEHPSSNMKQLLVDNL